MHDQSITDLNGCNVQWWIRALCTYAD